MFAHIGNLLRDTWGNGILPLRRRRTPHDFTLGANLTLTGLLAIGVVLIGYSYALAPSAAAMNKLADSGEVFLTSSDLVAHAKMDHSSGYWLGPRGGSVFLLNDDKPGVGTISYLPKGARPSAKHSGLLSIATYDDYSGFSLNSHGLTNDPISQLAANGGGTVQFNLASMNEEVVTIPRKPQIIVITYPTAQTAEALRSNAGKLQLIQ